MTTSCSNNNTLNSSYRQLSKRKLLHNHCCNINSRQILPYVP